MATLLYDYKSARGSVREAGPGLGVSVRLNGWDMQL
jgi:hypothetical protein